ncbi:hypothetical protein [Flavobacterium silvaticum]|uniref:Uncharacterized protein n=1 Tax=Flavobacterium silvaticum TaxID=1852020 RepID=A0A972FTZ0_9FLAO|nr:hypothetical protein [Flavobacterium silvaticum]NMH28448.1 hypothetical protein [Flavobacterium silvaticum]
MESFLSNLADQSNGYAMGSPFKEKSLFYASPELQSFYATFSDAQNSLWKYKIIKSAKGSELIEQYKRYDAELEKSEGTLKEDLDFIVFIETDGNISFGDVLLIKMGNAMLKAFFTKPGIAKSWSQSLARQIAELGFRENDYLTAFGIEAEYRLTKNTGTIKETPQEIVGKMVPEISKAIRKLKLDPAYWDPGLKSEKYLGFKASDALAFLENSVGSLESGLSNMNKQLVLISRVRLIDQDNPFLKSAVSVLSSLEASMDAVGKTVKRLRTMIPLEFAFICGIVDGLIEFICGIVDAILILLELFLRAQLTETAEDYLFTIAIREALEELAEKFLADPMWLSKEMDQILKQMSQEARAANAQKNACQKAHDAGEYLIFIIDIVLSFVALVKGMATSEKYLPEVVDWVDDISTRNRGKILGTEGYLEDIKYGKLFRVQGGAELPNSSKYRFLIYEDKVSIKGKEMLHITFDDGYRTAEIWSKRGDKAEVFIADIEEKFIEKIRKEAVPQEYGRAFPKRPQMDDLTKTPNSFGIPENYFEELLNSIKDPKIVKY